MPRKKKKPVNRNRPLGDYVEVGADHLRQRLALFRPILARKPGRKDLASYHFTVRQDGVAVVAATNLRVRLQLRLEVLDRRGEGTILLDAAALNAMLAAYTEPRVRIRLDDPTEVRVEGRQIRLKLPGYDPETELKASAEGSLTRSGWLFRGRDLAAAIRRTRFAAEADPEDDKPGQFALRGIAFVLPDADRADAELVASEGPRIARHRLAVEPFGVAPARLWRPNPKDVESGGYVPVLPNGAVAAALRLAELADGDRVGVAVIPEKAPDATTPDRTRPLIQVVTRDAVLTAPLAENRFPQYAHVWPTDEPEAELRLADARALGQLVGTAYAATDADDADRMIEFVLAGGFLMMTVKSEARGEAMLTLDVPDSKGRATFDVRGHYLHPFFAAIGSDPVRLQVFGPKKLIRLEAGPSTEYLVVPLAVAIVPPDEKDGPGDTPEGDGGEPEPEPEPKPEPRRKRKPKPEPEPEPVTPSAVAPDGYVDNGEAEPPAPRRRRRK